MTSPRPGHRWGVNYEQPGPGCSLQRGWHCSGCSIPADAGMLGCWDPIPAELASGSAALRGFFLLVHGQPLNPAQPLAPLSPLLNSFCRLHSRI